MEDRYGYGAGVGVGAAGIVVVGIAAVTALGFALANSSTKNTATLLAVNSAREQGASSEQLRCLSQSVGNLLANQERAAQTAILTSNINSNTDRDACFIGNGVARLNQTLDSCTRHASFYTHGHHGHCEGRRES